MADWSKPTLASNYTNFVTEVSTRDVDIAVQFDPAVVAPTNVPVKTIRWRSAAKKWEIWDGVVWGDLTSLYAISVSGTAANITGIAAAVNGGTGHGSYAVGDIAYAVTPTTLGKLADIAVGSVLLSGGVNAAPSYGKVGLASHVSGTLPTANGGTGTASLTGICYGNGGGAFTAATALQLVTAISTTYVANASYATAAGSAASAGKLSLAPGASGNVLTSNGSAWVSLPAPGVSDGSITPAKLTQKLTLGTAVATTAGTSIDFTGIPSWVKRITVMLNAVSTNGGSNLQVQVGSGSVTSTGYFGNAGNAVVQAYTSTGFLASCQASAGFALNGSLTLSLIGNNTWAMQGCTTLSPGGTYNPMITAGVSGALAGPLDRVRLTTLNGTDIFDAGAVNLLYEG